MTYTKILNKNLKYYEAVGNILTLEMKRNKKIFIAGLEVNYSSKVFKTLEKPYRFFKQRFIQTPAMENSLCNILAGAAISGIRPVFVNNRCDFLLLSFDSIVNIIDKWKYMFDANAGSCPVVITAIIGRGWGQGATHSQSFHNFFSRLSGFNVFLPACPDSVTGVYKFALRSKSPSIILQHRSLLNLEKQKKINYKAGKSNIIQVGNNLLIIAISYSTIQAVNVAKILLREYLKKISIIDLVSIRPLDIKTIIQMSKDHKNIIILDIDHIFAGISSEIECIIKNKFKNKKIKKIGNKFMPSPVSHELEKEFYPSDYEILKQSCKMLKLKIKSKHKIEKNYYDYKSQGPY
jgi:pyruvate/2-oxoglutarate/acetoin dehydrogenase E1 component